MAHSATPSALQVGDVLTAGSAIDGRTHVVAIEDDPSNEAVGVTLSEGTEETAGQYWLYRDHQFNVSDAGAVQAAPETPSAQAS